MMENHALLDFDRRLDELDLYEVVKLHLANRLYATKDFAIRSSLDALQMTMTKTRASSDTKIFAPALCAFAILDQIGKCYSSRNMPSHPSEGTGIHRALYYFCDMPAMSASVKALYAFRNGLVHDGSFTSRDQKSGKWYIFRSDETVALPVVMAETPWDGSSVSLSGKTTTWVNTRLLTEIVLSGLNKLRLNVERDSSIIKVEYSRNDIINRFLLWMPLKEFVDSARPL